MIMRMCGGLWVIEFLIHALPPGPGERYLKLATLNRRANNVPPSVTAWPRRIADDRLGRHVSTHLFSLRRPAVPLPAHLLRIRRRGPGEARRMARDMAGYIAHREMPSLGRRRIRSGS